MSDFAELKDAFERVADDIYRLRSTDDESHIGPAAARALRENRDSLLSLPPTSMLQWALRGELPAQSWSNDFGDPALTLVDRPDFRIDVLYWDHNASPTHKHVSCGAFMAHFGDRLHQRFSFDSIEQVDEYLTLGELKAEQREAIAPGFVQEIQPELIHDLFWLKRPSITISVRCKNHPGGKERPTDFWSPGLQALDMVHHDTPIVRRQISALQLLRSTSRAAFEREVSAAIVEGSASLAYQTLVLLAEHSDSISTYASVSELLAQRGDALAARLAEAYGHFRRKSELAGVYAADRAAQTLVALMWAGANGEEAQRVLADYMPEMSVGEAAQLAVDRVSTVDQQLADLLRSRAAELLPDSVGTC